ncbi:MAG: metallophosphoesterase family protein [Caldimicrobium sp.]
MTIEEPAIGISIFAIGDIHGSYYSLKALLELIPIRWGIDYLIFLGDYIDRGPESRKVLELIINLKETYPDKVFPLKGNHEWMFERYLAGKDIEVFLYNGGYETLKNYIEDGKLKIPSEHINFIQSLPLYVEIGKYFFVHAGINPAMPLYEQSEEDLLWIRQSFYLFDSKFQRKIIFGHTPFPEVLHLEDRIGIDTGCVYGGKLTSIKLPEEEIFQIECRGRYNV